MGQARAQLSAEEARRLELEGEVADSRRSVLAMSDKLAQSVEREHLGQVRCGLCSGSCKSRTCGLVADLMRVALAPLAG